MNRRTTYRFVSAIAAALFLTTAVSPRLAVTISASAPGRWHTNPGVTMKGLPGDPIRTITDSTRLPSAPDFLDCDPDRGQFHL